MKIRIPNAAIRRDRRLAARRRWRLRFALVPRPLFEGWGCSYRPTGEIAWLEHVESRYSPTNRCWLHRRPRRRLSKGTNNGR